MCAESSSPDRRLNKSDRGDDTQRRFRYQAGYAASVSLYLIEEDSEFEEIFCEQFEDILIRRKDGTFVGIQVKTRDVNLGPFTFGDPEVMNSLKRFVTTEREFPGKFRKYVLCSNCGFWQKKKDASNLVHCLGLIRKYIDSEAELPADILKRINTLSNKSRCDKDSVVDVLCKVETQEWASLKRYEISLAAAIARVTRESGQSYFTLQKAATSLIAAMSRAASLPHDSPRIAYFALLENPESERVDTVITDKRITPDIVRRIIDESLNPVTSLRTLESVDISDLPKGMRTMELKMAGGGLSPQNIDLAKDLKYSALTLLVGWFHKYGSKEVNQRYEYLSIVARSEYQEAYDLVKIDRVFWQ